MGIIAPTPKRKKTPIQFKASFSDQKKWISQEFYSALNEFTELSDGNRMTKIQAAVRSVVDSMLDAETDPYYRLAALKFVTEHIEGKAAVMKEETREEMPKFAIVIGETTAQEIKKAVDELNPNSIDEAGSYVELEDENGGNCEEMIV